MVDFITYTNQGAIRNHPLSPRLVDALSFLPDMGLGVEVFSGGQDATGPRRTGSTRHDHGMAADVFFTRDGKRLDWRNPEDIPVLQNIVRNASERGLTGFGAGPNYMQPGSMHIGFGAPAVWGAKGRGANAPAWLREAVSQTPQQAVAADTMAALGKAPRQASQPPQTLLGSEGNDNMAEQPQGLLGGTKLGEFLTPDRRDHLIAALEGMTLNPNQALIQAAGGRIQQRQQERAQAQQANRTVEFLRARGREDLIELARMDPRAAIQAAMQQPKAPGTKVIDGRLVNEQTGEVIADFSAPDVAVRQITGAELIKQYGLQEGGNIQPGALYNVKSDGSISQIGGAGTTVNVGGEIDPFKKKVAEIDAKTFSEMANVGIEARRTLAETNVLNKLLENSPTGFAANAAVWAKNNLGVNVTGGPVQALEASISRLVPAQRPPGSGVMSDADLELYKRSLPQLINSPEGNRIIVKTMRGAAEYNMQIGEIANQVLSGRISREQGRDMMLALPDPMAEAMTYIDTLSDNSGATPAPAPTGVATHRYNPQTGKIEEIK